MDFVGRELESATLAQEVAAVRNGVGRERPGRCLIVRGRRRVGKSRLLEHFLQQTGTPSLYFTASGSAEAAELASFTDEAARSDLPGRDVLTAGSPRDWDSAFRLLAAALPGDEPAVVVIDEVPYLMDDRRAFEGVLQRAWDRVLSRLPVLLVLIGSDLTMMEALTDYARPFHQRGREMVVGPLTPADVGRLIGRPAAEAVDATLLTGGLPMLCAEWREGEDMWSFLQRAVGDPTSPLLVSAERSLSAEFPAQLQARTVLSAIGTGERTFGSITRSANSIAAAPLQRALTTLVDKRLVVAELPLAMTPSKERRYRLVDPYLRFWLQFLGPYLAEIERGRGDLTMRRIRAGWSSWRGRAVEPLIREALFRLAPTVGLPAAGAVGGYWTRTNDVEVDIVGADRGPIASQLLFIGSIKWREQGGFDRHDTADLLQQRALLTPEPIPTVAVTRTRGSAVDVDVDVALSAEDLLQAWGLG